MVDGTWGGAAPPQETIVFTLCREFKTSPERLREEWSPYEQRFFWDYLQEVWNQEKAEVEKAKSKQGQ